MATDLEIAREAKLEPIENIARTAGFLPETVSPYGRYVAKIDQRAYADLPQRAKLVLVTAINPTPAGEGKTTVSVALADGMRCIGKNAMLALREPSLGPVFGMKGGATGGGYAQVVPMESINLHFTGDLHAITAANNLLCAMVDNHIQQGNALGIDPRRTAPGARTASTSPPPARSWPPSVSLPTSRTSRRVWVASWSRARIRARRSRRAK